MPNLHLNSALQRIFGLNWMTNYALYKQKKQWLLLLLTLVPLLGLRAQCSELPVFQTIMAGANQPCSLFVTADINALPNGTSLCFRTNAATGNLIPGSLSGAFRTALLSGGGVPVVTSTCGGEVEVCVSDDITDNGPCGDNNRLIRRYAARNLAVNADGTPVVLTENIVFVRPQIADLRAVEEAIFVIPDDGFGIPDNPLPARKTIRYLTSVTLRPTCPKPVVLPLLFRTVTAAMAAVTTFALCAPSG